MLYSTHVLHSHWPINLNETVLLANRLGLTYINLSLVQVLSEVEGMVRCRQTGGLACVLFTNSAGTMARDINVPDDI